jgi:hypothetical protein
VWAFVRAVKKKKSMTLEEGKVEGARQLESWIINASTS